MRILLRVILSLALLPGILSCGNEAPTDASQLITNTRYYITPLRIDTARVSTTYKDTNIANILLSPLDSLLAFSFSRVDSVLVDSIIRTILIEDIIYEDGFRLTGVPDTAYDTVPGLWVYTTTLQDTLRHPRFDTVKIMPLGNSITEGEDHQSNYRKYLWRLLDSADYRADFVGSIKSNDYLQDSVQLDYDPDHEGWSGWTTHDLLDSLSMWLKKQVPDIVLCHAGTNNSDEDIDTTIASVREMIDVMRAANPKIIILLAQITPMIYYEEIVWVKHYNQKLDSLGRAADSEESPIVIVDQYSGMDIEEDLSDGVHPNRAGYKKMAAKWFQMLRCTY